MTPNQRAHAAPAITFTEAAVEGILAPVSLTLTEQRISIIGANGSGKSTLARLMNGLIEPSSGTVTIHTTDDAGHRCAHDTVRDGPAVRRQVAFSFTDPAAQLIMPTVLEDVALSFKRQYRRQADRDAAARDALDRFGLADLAERSVHQLSGGQRQLVALTSVLATHPEILIADEPTTLLDLQNSRTVSDLLWSLTQQVIVVTHDLALAERAERTLVIADGRIAFDGAPDAAIAHYRASV